MNDQEHKLWAWVPIDPSNLMSRNLRVRGRLAGWLAGAYRIHIWVEESEDGVVINEISYSEKAEAIVVPSASDPTRGRIGIAWGGNAAWGDVGHLWATDIEESDESPEHICDGTHDLEQAIEDRLNDAAAWAARA